MTSYQPTKHLNISLNMKAIHILFYINIEILNKRHHISVEINVWWDCMINNNKSVCRSPLLHLRYFYIIFIAAYIALLNAIKIVTSLFYTTKQTHYVGEDNIMLLDRKMLFLFWRIIRVMRIVLSTTKQHESTRSTSIMCLWTPLNCITRGTHVCLGE